MEDKKKQSDSESDSGSGSGSGSGSSYDSHLYGIEKSRLAAYKLASFLFLFLATLSTSLFVIELFFKNTAHALSLKELLFPPIFFEAGTLLFVVTIFLTFSLVSYYMYREYLVKCERRCDIMRLSIQVPPLSEGDKKTIQTIQTIQTTPEKEVFDETKKVESDLEKKQQNITWWGE